MNTYEAKELLANSLKCLAMSMEQIRLYCGPPSS